MEHSVYILGKTYSEARKWCVSEFGHEFSKHSIWTALGNSDDGATFWFLNKENAVEFKLIWWWTNG